MSTASAAETQLSYQLSFDDAAQHYVDVKMDINNWKGKDLIVKLPVWAPGSYLVREFARNVEQFQAVSGSTPLKVHKINKNTWKISTNKVSSISIRYKVYAFELTVRTSFIDAAHAYLNGTSIFMYIDGKKELPSTIKVTPTKNWKEISTGLEAVNGDKWTLSSPNYDILADSPIEIGNQEILKFEAAGVPHEIALYGGGNYDKAKLTRDVKQICEEATKVFDSHPCKHYTFIVHCMPSGGGGLEHLNSTTVQTSKFGFSNDKSYKSFLSLIAHEYFHLWNVKRLRPEVLGPFDYDNENYTTMLWFSEGFTAYYDNLLTRRAGFYTPDAYLDILTTDINKVVNQPGNYVQPVAEASFDAWIKYYRPNENSSNSTISYYDKGSILALILDMEILRDTKGAKDLDDLMKYLYNEFYLGKKRGFTDAEFKAAAEKICGRNLDEFFINYVNGTSPIPFNDYLSAVGLSLVDQNAGSRAEINFGANTKTDNGKIVVTSVTKGTSAYEAGINVNDEIIAFDNYRVDDLAKWLGYKKVGDKVDVLVSREGFLITIPVTLKANTNVKYKFVAIKSVSTEQAKSYNFWMKFDTQAGAN
ncbi:PDZ domain-containing protein [Solitalea sp. MAHUQ-68]|uniref:PDZ domain-containing protein n=1 Tax=Solitalea agri TaxID=2953739 RepID=A0A9X2F3N0_9SPHI|nr:PDZ domain-containing protein [Solitalea agri]MCO4293661.1 PDZ domain-containing protein [Solitalea agri]